MNKNNNMLFSIVNLLAIIILPLLILFSILYTMATTPLFYTTILKKTDLINTFVKAKNIELTRAIQEEIDKKVGLAWYALTYESLKRQYQEAKKAYETINKTQEYQLLQKKCDEIKNLSFNDVKHAFSNKSAFEEDKSLQLKNIQKQIESIEQYRNDYKDDIKAAYSKLEEIEEQFQDAEEEYNDKQEEVNEIIEKHRNTFAAQLNEDLDVLKPSLTKIINEKLIDGNIFPLIERYIRFFTSYNTIRSEYILELNDESNPLNPKKVTQILLPDITISLWVDEGGKKRHLLSDIIANEIKNTSGIKNKTFFVTAFTLADTAIGELLGSRYLKKAGLWFSDGVIYKHNIVLTGSSADTTITIVKILSYGKFLVYATIALLIAYQLFIYLSASPRLKKMLWIKRFLLYPSLIFIVIGLLCIALPYLLIKQSDTLSLITAMILRTVSFNTTMCVFIPVILLFTVAFICGLILRKKYIRMTISQ